MRELMMRTIRSLDFKIKLQRSEISVVDGELNFSACFKGVMADFSTVQTVVFVEI
jgi:hypothetical protein